MRCLLISDIHGNLEALKAVLDDVDLQQIDAVWHLGDVVGYGPDPNACVELLRSLPNLLNVAGNHDWAIIEKLDISDFNAEARWACNWTKNRLSDDSWEYLSTLEEKVVEGDFTIVHGSPQYPIWEYILHTSTAMLNFDHFLTRFCLIGHTHAPVVYHYTEEYNPNGACEAILPPENEPYEFKTGRYIINPGSVGQPRDGDPRSSYVILDTDANTVTYHRVEYPIEETQGKMEEQGLPIRLIARLSHGW